MFGKERYFFTILPHFSALHVPASNASVATLAIFACWGAAPNPAGLWDNLSQSPVVASQPLSGLFLILTATRHAQEIVNIPLDGNELPHLLLRLPVVGSEGLFPGRQLQPALF